MDAEGADHSAPFDAPAPKAAPVVAPAPAKSAMAAAVGDDEMF